MTHCMRLSYLLACWAPLRPTRHSQTQVYSLQWCRFFQRSFRVSNSALPGHALVHPRPSDLRYPIVTSLIHLHASLLLPLFNHLWLSQGTGNANFFYASTLVFGIANGAALMDCVWAGLRIALGEMKEGYEVVQQ